MSVARGFGQNGKSLYSNVTKPCEINLNFVVDSSNGNGLGVRSLKSNGYVNNVFMHTAATPGSNNGYLNPNPVAGYALIQLTNNFNYYLGGFSGFVSAVANPTTPVTSGLTAHAAYIITSVGTTTTAEWQSIGLPVGLTPTAGQSFIATSTGTGGSHTGTVGTPSPSGITCVEVVGDPNQSISPANIAQNGGAWVLVSFLGATNSSTTTLIPTAPANGSVCGMNIRFDGSSVTIDGL
jgi:hypothetical protein